ncbi:MAG TPA: FAD-linked oxidase [Planctomycetaceae bacterium]|nr:FAD-linked oxidase [Planctomycetaceae bacterium]
MNPTTNHAYSAIQGNLANASNERIIVERMTETDPLNLAGMIAGLQPVGATVAKAAEWFAAVIGKEHVLCDDASRFEYSKSTLPRSTTPAIIVRPGSVSEVQQIVKGASIFGLKPHAISRGKNWGYGDACAQRDGQLIVDLRRMNRIVEINEELAYAVIEPGVTQGQLAEELLAQGARLMLDVTGAGPDASIVGNILQRGFGHTPYGDRVAHSCNYQVVLPDGTIKQTGFGDVTGSNVGHVYPYGNGPCTQGLFAQSHAGIVTRMTIWLMPHYERVIGFGFKTNETEVFALIVDRIGQLRRDGTIGSVVHIANDIRVLSTQRTMKEHSDNRAPLTAVERAAMAKEAGIGQWNGLGGLYGSRRIVSAKKKEIKKAFKDICPIRFFCKWQVRTLKRVSCHLPSSTLFDPVRNISTTIADVYDLLCGTPSNKHLEGAFCRNRPKSGEVIDAGLIWISPVIPCSGKDAKRLVSAMAPIANGHGFDLPITISPVTPRSAVCVTNICFNKLDNDESKRASLCYKDLSSAINNLGYPPYRKASTD